MPPAGSRRKKRPGGRRPRDSSGATSPLTVRVTPDQRKRCEAAAGDEPVATWAARALVEVAERGTERPKFSTLEDVLSMPLDDVARFSAVLWPVLLGDPALLRGAIIASWTNGVSNAAEIRAACERFVGGRDKESR